jgi:hypothetical protein
VPRQREQDDRDSGEAEERDDVVNSHGDGVEGAGRREGMGKESVGRSGCLLCIGLRTRAGTRRSASRAMRRSVTLWCVPPRAARARTKLTQRTPRTLTRAASGSPP